VVTVTLGGVISGYWATGSKNIQVAPIKVIIKEQTVAKTGLRIKKSEIDSSIGANYLFELKKGATRPF
jgi:hypothetical protein